MHRCNPHLYLHQDGALSTLPDTTVGMRAAMNYLGARQTRQMDWSDTLVGGLVALATITVIAVVLHWGPEIAAYACRLWDVTP